MFAKIARICTMIMLKKGSVLQKKLFYEKKKKPFARQRKITPLNQTSWCHMLSGNNTSGALKKSFSVTSSSASAHQIVDVSSDKELMHKIMISVLIEVNCSHKIILPKPG